ncbi:hypothetical protein [uncultured Shewanella sp.]|uniref:hypothetical protein n=1 Tax=uncultured Shewanella sp. TaxID=173975 RepID=UPI0026204EE5|nr:hypothetical protein [uncultured Shewanella sp.]
MESVKYFLTAVFCCFFILSCGGGGSFEEESDEPTEETYFLALSISQQAISAANPATVTATVSSSKRGLLENELVTFALNDPTLGSFDPITGTAITDINGQAQVMLYTSNIKGAGSITATLTNQIDTNDTHTFTMLGDGGAAGLRQVILELIDADGNAIESITPKQPGQLKARVIGTNDPVIVTFTSQLASIPINTVVTQEGVAIADIYAATQLGADTATASISSEEFHQVIFTVGAKDLKMGAGEVFEEGLALVSIDELSAGGTATVSIEIRDDEGNLYTDEFINVNFSSICTDAGLASLSSPVIAINGEAKSTYRAEGCVGEDVITVTADVGTSLSARGSIEIFPADRGSIEFVSATPEQIGIKNTGGIATSLVIFKVLDVSGQPMSNETVYFSLNTAVGGLDIYPTEATTNAEGLVQTTVNAGTTATPIRVTAYLKNDDEEYDDISSQSSELVVTTGIADQDSFSLSASNYSPEGWDIDGTEVIVTARLADAFNNPVPDGTAVTFRTEGGSIDDYCFTINGSCFVTWRSQDVRPDGAYWGDTDHPADLNGYFDVQEAYSDTDFAQPMGGRVTITAFAIGEESFADTNGNGRFDEAERPLFLGDNTQGEPYDMAEAFEDFNEDGVFNPYEYVDGPRGEAGGELEELIDFNGHRENVNGFFDIADGKYNGVLCGCALDKDCDFQEPKEEDSLEPDPYGHVYCGLIEDGTASIHVRKNIVLVMSGSTAYASQPIITDSDGGTRNQVMDIVTEGIGSLSMIISDLHNQTLPSGTTIEFETSAGRIATSPSITVQDRGGEGLVINVSVQGGTEPESGMLDVMVRTPSGVETIVASIPVVIS